MDWLEVIHNSKHVSPEYVYNYHYAVVLLPCCAYAQQGYVFGHISLCIIMCVYGLKRAVLVLPLENLPLV